MTQDKFFESNGYQQNVEQETDSLLENSSMNDLKSATNDKPRKNEVEIHLEQLQPMSKPKLYPNNTKIMQNTEVQTEIYSFEKLKVRITCLILRIPQMLKFKQMF